MITKLHMRQLFLYGLIGGAAALVDYGVFYLFQNRAGWSAEVSSLIGQGVGFVFSFYLNTYLNFKKTDRLFRRFISYFAICVLGMAISTALIVTLKSRMDIYVLKLVCLLFVSLVQFLLNKLITYRF